MLPPPLRIVGVPGSPYSRKLRAVLRYRRIAHAWVTAGSRDARRLPTPRIELLPQLVLPGADGTPEARTDSTPLIRELERLYEGRSVLPPHPALAFLDALLEDFADEWVTKAMFHYRWAYAPDAEHAAAILPRWFRTTGPDADAVANGKAFAARQIGRLAVVGSSPETAPIIERSYHRVLGLLDAHLTHSPFLFGGRPAAGDFGLFGQLTQLALFDPTPAAIACQLAPRVVAWVDIVDDLSGLEPDASDWIAADAVPGTIRALLAEIGRVYAPFLLANAEALTIGRDAVDCVLDGERWRQRPFPYQGKCLAWLRDAYARLASTDRGMVDSLLRDTGCEALFRSA